MLNQAIARANCTVLLSLVVLLASITPSMSTDAVSPERSTELRNLLSQDCGSCHGMHLTGGIGPALNVDAIKNLPAEYLAATIRDGRPDTAMPPWKNLLSDTEIDWLVSFLKSSQTPAAETAK